MKHELFYETQAAFNAAQGNSGNVTSITPGVAYVLETNGVVGYNKRWDTLMIEYQVDDVSSPTKIYNSASVKNNLKEIIVDKTHIPASAVTDTYQFSSPGLHRIRFRYSSITIIPDSAFANCVNITRVLKIPKTVIEIDGFAFGGCSNLVEFSYTTPTFYRANVFAECRNIKSISVVFDGGMYSYGVFNRSGGPGTTSTLSVKGVWGFAQGQGGTGDPYMYHKHIFIDGDITKLVGGYAKETTTLKITGNCSASNDVYGIIGPSLPEFIEILGNITSTGKLFRGGILHLGYGEKISANPATIGIGAVSKVYVGDGSSQEHDQQILDAYLADENWTPYTSKLDLWYNYNGQYKE